jgi:hypothetical protein
MDVAAFVGLAASGPLHVPVPVEDPARFTEIFGADPVLAWDRQRGQWATAHLGAAVRAFFRNGGRRCWVVRVAETEKEVGLQPPATAAASNRFIAPGLWWHGAAGWAPATFVARSPGSWADGLQLEAGVERTPLAVRRVDWSGPSRGTLWLGSAPLAGLAAGDLVRLRFVGGDVAPGHPGAGPRDGWAVVGECAYRTDEQAGGTRSLAVELDVRFWTASVDAASLGSRELKATRWPRDPSLPESLGVRLAGGTPAGAGRLDPGASQVGQLPVDFEVSRGHPAAIRPGESWCIRSGARDLLLSVTETFQREGPVAGDATLVVRGHAARVLPAGASPGANSGPLSAADLLALQFRVGTRDEETFRLAGLGFEGRHPRFAGALPTDADLFFDDPSMPDHAAMLVGDGASDAWRRRRPNPHEGPVDRYAGLRSDVGRPRFPLAGDGPRDAVYFPFALAIASLKPLPASHQDRDALDRDGLSVFSLDWFEDPKLKGVGATALMGDADFVRYGASRPRPLRGIHALLGIEEVSLVAVPDAVQPGWDRAPSPAPEPDRSGALVPHPEWSECCDPGDPAALAEVPPLGRFLPARARVVARPYWVARRCGFDPDGTGALRLAWKAEAGATVELERSASGTFDDVQLLYRGADASFRLQAAPASSWYRVRAFVGGVSSHWSAHRRFAAEPAMRYELRTARDAGGSVSTDGGAEAADSAIVALQRDVLQMCAARGDLFAVLATPAGLREDAAVAHAGALGVTQSGDASAPSGATPDVPSHGALYLPWVMVGAADDREPRSFRPPDGAACGLIAARSRTRGAWVAPANEPLRGIVSLDPSPVEGLWKNLYGSQVNGLRHDPRGFMAMSDWTLGREADLRPIGVRRLLHLLRRLALRVGRRWVFEPNGPVLRRAVKRSLEEALELLYQRGAFAGDTRAASFMVLVDDTVNPPESVDEGRFIAEIRVAPSLPMRFITVRLVQTGADGFAVLEG